MKSMYVRAAWVAAIMLLLAYSAGAQQSGTGRKVPQLTDDNLGASSQAEAAPIAGPVALLPPSDVIAIIDVGRVLDSLMPQLRTMAPDEIGKMMKGLDELKSKAGVDLLQIRTAVIGIRIPDKGMKTGSGAAILQGLDFDLQKLAAAAKAGGGGLKTFEHQGKPVFVVAKPKGKAPAGKDADQFPDEIALALLDRQSLVAGDVASVKGVLDAQASSGSGFSNGLLGEALNKTNPAGWVRFAVRIPDSFRQELVKQGASFKSFAAVKVLSGAFSFDGAGAALDLTMHASSSGEAAELTSQLKSFVEMGKAFLGGDKDPQLQAIGQLLDQIKIQPQATDVALSLYLPKELLDQFKQSKKGTAASVP